VAGQWRFVQNQARWATGSDGKASSRSRQSTSLEWSAKLAPKAPMHFARQLVKDGALKHKTRPGCSRTGLAFLYGFRIRQLLAYLPFPPAGCSGAMAPAVVLVSALGAGL